MVMMFGLFSLRPQSDSLEEATGQNEGGNAAVKASTMTVP